MTDYTKLKDIFEMAEVLEDFGDAYLELKTVNAEDTELVSIMFIFNDEEELVKVYTQ